MGGKQSFPVQSISRERIVIVTGGNTGIGYEIAKWVAMMGATVIIACRSEERAQQAIERMRKEFPTEKERLASDGVALTTEDLAVEFIKLDLMSFKSVLDFIEEFRQKHNQLHVLVCNAGIGMAQYKKTEDGFESILQTNYLGHFLMIAKLLPMMKASGEDCRIHLVSSVAHKGGSFNLATMNYEGNPNSFGRFDYYGRSKLYQIMQTFAMARRLKNTNITVTCSHPGAVDSEFERSFPDIWYFKMFYTASRKAGTLLSPLEGAKTPINCAVNPELREVSGEYFDKCKPATPNSTSRNMEKQEKLWTQTLDYLKAHLTAEDIRCMEGQS